MEINYNVQDIDSLTPSYLKAVVTDFIVTKRPTFIKLKEYYKNKTSILERTKPEWYMPNNKLNIGFQAYITDIETGYFLGEPIKYVIPNNPELSEYIADINRVSSEDSHNAKLSKEASKTGVAYELIYLNDNREIKLANLPSENTFMIRDVSIEEKVVAAINIVNIQSFIGKSTKTLVNVYTQSYITTYEYTSMSLKFMNTQPHYLADVPVIEYRNSDEAIGSYESHINSLDAYNMIISDTVNDNEQFANAILVIAADEDKRPVDEDRVDSEGNVIGKIRVEDRIKNTRTMILGTEGKASFLHKPSDNPGAFKALEVIKANLLMLTGVPDFGEGLSGNLSAAAIKNALFAFEQRLKNKENNFKAALNERLRLLVDLINFKHNTSFDYLDVKYVFTLNAPDSFSDSISYAKDTEGILSKHTRISRLVKDVEAEKELIKKEEEENNSNIEVVPETTLDVKGEV